ncbi:hypothetical protein PENTCL1PPCAC_24626, partial [Pristionchus entomophagus]
VFSVSLLFYISLPDFRYYIVTLQQNTQDSQILMNKLCPECRFIEEGRNFGVISRNDSITSGVLIIFINFSCAIFAFCCSGHIVYLLTKYRGKIFFYSVRTLINTRQTLVSLIQIIIFGTFLAVPIGLTIVMLWIGHH